MGSPVGLGLSYIWIYVTNNDPAVRYSLSGYTWLQVATGGGQWMIRIRLSPIAFNISGNEALKGSSCLHHPDDFAIRRYAQYAAGAAWMSTPPTNSGDPDTPEQAIRNLVQRVNGEFHYRDRWSTRQPDTMLLSTRYGYIGVSRDYADLTTGLLRALGIPARYTDAYFASPSRLIAGPLASLREPYAHAWVWRPTWVPEAGSRPILPGA